MPPVSEPEFDYEPLSNPDFSYEPISISDLDVEPIHTGEFSEYLADGSDVANLNDDNPADKLADDEKTLDNLSDLHLQEDDSQSSAS